MTNEALKAFIKEFGTRIFWIELNNQHKLALNIAPSQYDDKVVRPQGPVTESIMINPTTDQIQYKTIDGIDFFGIPRVSRTGFNTHPVKYTAWIVTAIIEIVYTLDDENETEIPDVQHIY